MDKDKLQSIKDRCKWRGYEEREKTWIYGYIIRAISEKKISIEHWFVSADTVGQYAGVKDKNGKEIYEGDILRSENGKLFVVVYDIEKKKFMLTNADGNLTFSVYKDDALSLEIVGNIYDNKELLTNK